MTEYFCYRYMNFSNIFENLTDDYLRTYVYKSFSANSSLKELQKESNEGETQICIIN